MNEKIWRILTQILNDRNDLVDIIKPFFENLKNENINAKKYIPLLQTFSKDQLECLYQNGVIKKETFYFLMPNANHQDQLFQTAIEIIIQDDKINELRELILEKNIKKFNTINKSFKEVEKMEIPSIQYCIMKKAINCFKYLLVNGYDDPNKLMEEQNPLEFYDVNSRQKKKFKRYEWDCMATAIYFGNKEIIKILEDKGFEKEKNPRYMEAAILSYRNLNDEIDKLNENNIIIQNFYDFGILASGKNNNIKGAELLIRNGANINVHDEKMDLILRMQHHFIMQQKIIQKKCLKY